MPIAAIGEDGRSGDAENAQDDGGTAEQTSHGWREEQIRRHRLGCIRSAYNSFTGKSLMTGVFSGLPGFLIAAVGGIAAGSAQLIVFYRPLSVTAS